MSRFLNLFSILAIVASLLGSAVTYTPVYAVGVVRYAQSAATGSGNCSSWANACTLQDALTVAVSGDKIWVRKGLHRLDTTDRTVSFVLKKGVAVYGGFEGTETKFSQRNLLNLAPYKTQLSGNNNSYHVVTSTDAGSTTILDGFTILAGNANGIDPNEQRGGGMYNLRGNPTLTNVTIINNSAIYGGGIYNASSSPKLTNVHIYSNDATDGGGMYNASSSPKLTNVTFHANSATNKGGGMYNASSNPILTNVTFINNSANIGGGIFNVTSNPILTNMTLSGNSATVEGGGIYINSGSVTLINTIIANSTSGGDCVGALNASSSNNLIEDTSNACGLFGGIKGNIVGADPSLAPLAWNGGFTEAMPLRHNSPALHVGQAAACPATDQRGMKRPQGGGCDIGAFELGSGDLDSTFSNDGIFETYIAGINSYARGIAIQPDGKIVVAGWGEDGATNGPTHFLLIRYNQDGSLDTTFSGDGYARPLSGINVQAKAVAVRNDKIVATGVSCDLNGENCDLVVVRLNISDGTPDTTFSNDGVVVEDYGGGDNGAQGVVIKSDGKIILAGWTTINGTNREFAVYRYTDTGALDTTFSGDGVSFGNFGKNKQDWLFDLVLQPDGMIVLVGASGDGLSGTTNNFAIARLKSNGSADTTFGIDSRQTTNFGGHDTAKALALQPDGKIVVLGSTCVPSTTSCRYAVARYNLDGSLDVTFNGTGKKTFGTLLPGAPWDAMDVLVEPKGRILIAGTESAADFALTRLLPSGALDKSFNGDGKAWVDLCGGDLHDNVYALARQESDGKYVLVGDMECFEELAVARVLP